MPAFGKESIKHLSTCHPDIQKVFNAVIKNFDCSVLYGFRTEEEQLELFKQGRKLVDGIWTVVNPLQVVTYKDGVKEKSMHNYYPSFAIDVVPYYQDPPNIRWKDRERMYYFAGYVIATAKYLGVDLRSGADWDQDTEVLDQTLMDLPHFERTRA